MTRLDRHTLIRGGVLTILLLTVVPTIGNPSNPQHLDMARSLLRGSVWIESPTTLHDLGTVDGRYFSPFPPLAAIVAIPATITPWPNTVFNSIILFAACAVVMLAGRLGDRWGGRPTGTWSSVAIGLGSGLWTAVAIHDTYHSAHILALLMVFLALAAATDRKVRPVRAGFTLGLGALSRQAVLLAAPALAALATLCGRRSKRWRRALVVLASVAVPVCLYLALNVVRFGSPWETGYGQAHHHPRIVADLAAHGVFSPAYLLRNLRVMLFGWPRVVPLPPYVVPNPVGLSIVLVSPWLLLAVLPLVRPDRTRARRVAAWCWFAAASVSIPHLLYVNTGWVQFGYRFALDWLPFLLLAAVLGVRRSSTRVAVPLLVAAVVVNAWGLLAVATWSTWSVAVP